MTYEFDSLVAGAPRRGEARFTTRNPARPAETVGVYSAASDADIATAVAAAHDAQRQWRRVPAVERGTLVGRFVDALAARTDDLARSITLEQGKPVQEARGEVGKGRGVATKKGTGDLLATVEVAVPAKLSAAEREAVEALAAAATESPRDHLLADPAAAGGVA